MSVNEHQMAITNELITQVRDMMAGDWFVVRSYSVEDHPGVFKSESIRIDINENTTLNVTVWRKL